ncbi:hypothetical protein CMI37_02690 [Candidatus Pacearchaeota archaeon]|nr:hypothetical protein [Candidatus Pacearchaeota archaeon]
MAVQMMSTIQRWEGLSVAGGDAKPAAPTFVGSTYYETDTGRTYLWNGVAWVIMPVHILNVQGGAYTIQDLMEQFQAMPDLARSPQSGTLTFPDATEQTLYEESDAHPFTWYGSRIDWTGANNGAGENTTIKAYIKLKNGGTYRIFNGSVVYLAAALPSPVITNHPNDANDALFSPVPVKNVYGVKLTATQAAVGGGWNTIDHEHFDSKRGG